MYRTKQKNTVYNVLSILPSRFHDEILRLASGRKEGAFGIREIHLRVDRVSTVLIGREYIKLASVFSVEESGDLLFRLCDGAVYAHRDSIASGFIGLRGGVRVGLCGRASYDKGSLVGISDVRSFLFRIPTGECEFAEEILSIYRSGVSLGMLIYSPPGVGKTTALRSLAYSLAGGKNPIQIAVIDERCEFDEDVFRDCEIDILKGYKRRAGIEIATRTMSGELIIIDEIGGDEAESILSVVTRAIR